MLLESEPSKLYVQLSHQVPNTGETLGTTVQDQEGEASRNNERAQISLAGDICAALTAAVPVQAHCMQITGKVTAPVCSSSQNEH